MNTIKNILFLATLLLFPLGITLGLFDIPGGFLSLALGFFAFFVYYIIQSIRTYKNNVSIIIFWLQILLILMSFSLFTRYLFHIFGDYPSIIIVPLFLFVSLLYLIKEKEKKTNLTIVTILYLLLTVPLFGIDFHRSPRQYIPLEWYNRYDASEGVPISLPYMFKYKDTEDLSIQANELRKKKQYSKSIMIYEKARTLEPNNARLLFDLSGTYARNNDIETAIALLDTAIMMDDEQSIFYNNRGLLYYKLKENYKAIENYEKAIQLDSTQFIYHANLALAYYYERSFDLSCQHIKKARSLGLEISNYKLLKRINKRYCN